MTYEYTYHVRSDDGIIVIPDIESELEIQSEFRDSDLDIEVTAVWIEMVNLLKQKSPALRALGMLNAASAEQDDWIWEQIKEREGVEYRGLGGNDPDGRLVRVRQ